MSDDAITNAVLLQHMQGMKSELQTQISGVAEDLRLFRTEVRQGLDEARQHRNALQEDLDASIQMLGRHQRKLAKLS